MDLGQDALHLLQIGPAAAVEVGAAAPRWPSRVRMQWPTAAAVTPSSLPASTKLWCRAVASPAVGGRAGAGAFGGSGGVAFKGRGDAVGAGQSQKSFIVLTKKIN